MLIFELKIDGSEICAFSIDWIDLFRRRDFIEIVSNDINIDDVFVVWFCPIFKWIFNEEVNNEIVFLDCSLILSALCFWW